MKFNIATTSMQKILNNISKLTNVKSTNRLYTAVKIEVLEDKIIIFAQNNIESIEVVETNVEIFSTGSVVVESKILHDLIKNIDDVSLELQLFDKSLLNIKTLNSVYQINVLNLNYNFETNRTYDYDIAIESEELIKLVKYNIYAIDGSKINPIIGGINLSLEQDLIKTFSTDSFRIANSYLNIQNDVLKNVIIYKRSAKDIISLIEDNNVENIQIQFNDDHIVLNMENINLQLKLIRGEYPRSADIDNFINEQQISVKLNTAKLENIIKRLMIFSNDESKSIVLSVENNKILLENENNMFGNGVESMNVDLSVSEPFNILLSGTYFVEALKNCSDEITLLLESDVRPVIIKDEKYKSSHLIIPLDM